MPTIINPCQDIFDKYGFKTIISKKTNLSERFYGTLNIDYQHFKSIEPIAIDIFVNKSMSNFSAEISSTNYLPHQKTKIFKRLIPYENSYNFILVLREATEEVMKEIHEWCSELGILTVKENHSNKTTINNCLVI